MNERKPTVVFPVKNQFSQEEMEKIAELLGATIIEEAPDEVVRYDSLDAMIQAIREHIAATGELVVSRDIPTGPLIGFQAESGKHWGVGLKAIRENTNETLRRGMSRYLKKKPEGKLIHDPLALAVVINPTVCDFREVEVYRSNGEWGSKLAPGSNTQISVSVHRERLFETLMRH